MEKQIKIEKDESQFGVRSIEARGGNIQRKYDIFCDGIFSWQSCNESFGIIAVKKFEYHQLCGIFMEDK